VEIDDDEEISSNNSSNFTPSSPSAVKKSNSLDFGNIAITQVVSGLEKERILSINLEGIFLKEPDGTLIMQTPLTRFKEWHILKDKIGLLVFKNANNVEEEITFKLADSRDAQTIDEQLKKVIKRYSEIYVK